MSIDWTAIKKAIRTDNVAAINEFIANGADINTRVPFQLADLYNDRDTPLLGYAAYCNAINIVKELLRQGADINLTNSCNMTPLCIALEHSIRDEWGYESIPLITTLLEAKADVSIKNKWGYDAVHLAAEVGSIGALKALLEIKPDLSTKNESGYTALHCASQIDRHIYAKKLVEYGADVNAIADFCNLTPIDIAIELKNRKTVEALIEVGACVNKVSEEQEMSPLDRALIAGNAEIINMLKDAGAENTDYINTLPFAVLLGDVDRIKSSLDGGADPNARYKSGYNIYGYTVLGVGLKHQRPDIAKMLIDAGADVNLTNGAYSKPMGVIAADLLNVQDKDICLALIKLLVEAGADMNIAAKDGCTPLHCACVIHLYDVAALMLKNGADPNMQDEEGETALMKACYKYDHKELITLLLKYKADPNLQNKLGETGLIIACRNYSEYVVKRLIKCKNIDINLQDNLGYTALMIACGEGKDFGVGGDAKIATMLFEKGADPYIRNKEGKTALDMNVQNLLDINLLFEEYVKDFPVRKGVIKRVG